MNPDSEKSRGEGRSVDVKYAQRVGRLDSNLVAPLQGSGGQQGGAGGDGNNIPSR